MVVLGLYFSKLLRPSFAIRMSNSAIDQTNVIASLRQAISSSPNAEAQKSFCTDFTLRRCCFHFASISKRLNFHSRYLTARNWNLEKAKSMLLETLEWRVRFQADSITGSSVYENGKTGKVFVSGIDLQGRPVLYMRPGTASFSSVQHFPQLCQPYGRSYGE